MRQKLVQLVAFSGQQLGANVVVAVWPSLRGEARHSARCNLVVLRRGWGCGEGSSQRYYNCCVQVAGYERGEE